MESRKRLTLRFAVMAGGIFAAFVLGFILLYLVVRVIAAGV